MYAQQLTGNWEQQARRRWSKLTEEDLAMIGGECERLVDAVQKGYGLTREEAKLEVDQFCRSTALVGEEHGTEECETGSTVGACSSSPAASQHSSKATGSGQRPAPPSPAKKS